MHASGGANNPAGDMIVRRFIAAAIVLCLGSAVGACGQFSGYVADRWPHWAGGMPDDVPPRPGAPGYDEFVAHGQADQGATKSAATGEKPDAGKPVFAENPVAGTVKAPEQAVPAAPTAPSDNAPPEDPSVVKGGLY